MSDFESFDFIDLKDDRWLDRQKVAGRCVASVLKEAGSLIEGQTPGLSLKDIESMALSKMGEHKCTPTFLNYEGFPSAICTSVNKQLVHGVVTDYKLQPGDVVSVDVGATFEGAIADAARTWIYGEPIDKRHVEVLDVCKKALQAGIDKVKVGNRLGQIGNAIYKTVKDTEFGLVTNYGGHSISWNDLHSGLFVANKQSPNTGIRMTSGLSIAIEPMVTIGPPKTKIGKDGFTVYTNNIGCHFEDSITIFNRDVHNLTKY